MYYYETLLYEYKHTFSLTTTKIERPQSAPSRCQAPRARAIS